MQEYVITDGRDTRAVILPEKGATVVSFQHRGKEFLYRDDVNLNSVERPRCGIPFLFPIFGRLKDSSYSWEEKSYRMEIHGFGHTSAWQILESRPDTLKLMLEAGEESLAQYPFRFRVILNFTVEDGILSIAQTYENSGAKPMPYNFGFHPYFLTEKPENIRVETTADTFFDFAVGGKPFGTGEVVVTMPQGAPETGAAFMGVHGPTVLRNAAEGRKLTMEFDDSFHTHVLWAQNGKKFLCVEPVNGTADGLNTGNYLTLAPGESKQAFVSFRAEII